jgi:crotonobetainyl-CoA:carnitine CoA-transferase CaiB-like acyl-CoA transferase
MTKTPAATDRPAALGGLRVLDLSGPTGNYCGKMFADMGADVILVEPPSDTSHGTACQKEQGTRLATSVSPQRRRD